MSKNKAIAHPRDLVGKKVLIPFKNDMPDIVFQAMLKKLGIDIRKISVSYATTSAEAVGLFLGKDFDAIIVPKPMGSATILRGKTMGVNVVRGFDMTKMFAQAFQTKPMIPQAGIITNVDFFQRQQSQV